MFSTFITCSGCETFATCHYDRLPIEDVKHDEPEAEVLVGEAGAIVLQHLAENYMKKRIIVKL